MFCTEAAGSNFTVVAVYLLVLSDIFADKCEAAPDSIAIDSAGSRIDSMTDNRRNFNYANYGTAREYAAFFVCIT